MSTSAVSASRAFLIEGVRAGSPDALSALYLEHGAVLFRLAYRIVGAREDAEDVVHDVFVGLPEALRRYEERGSFGGWLKRVTARLALMRLRSRRRRREVALEGVELQQGAAPDPEPLALPTGGAAVPERLGIVLVLREIACRGPAAT